MRIQRMKAENIPIDLPANPAPHLVEWLMEIGPVASTGMGPTAISWADLRDWQEVRGIALNAWEGRTLQRLSRDFVSQSAKSREATCPAPYSSGETNHDAVTAQFKRMFAKASAGKQIGKRGAKP